MNNRNKSEEVGTERLERIDLVILGNEKRNVVVATAIGNHTNRDVADSVDNLGLEANVFSRHVTDNADDDKVTVDGDSAELAQIISNLVKMTIVVNGDGDANLRGGNHVNRGLVVRKDVEDLGEESVREEHVRTLDLDGGDAVLGGHRLDLVTDEVSGNSGSRRVRLHGVEKPNGDACLLGRENACRVKDFGAEVSKLSRLAEVERFDGFGSLDEARIVVVHAVDVGPNFDDGGRKRGTEDGGGVVATATLEVVNLTIGVHADEALGDVNLVRASLIENTKGVVLDEGHVGLGVLVGFHERKRIKKDGVVALLLHVVPNKRGGCTFALGNDDFLFDAGEEFAAVGYLTQDVETLLEELQGFLLVEVGGIEGINGILVFEFKFEYLVERTVGVALVEVVGNFEEGVGGAAHGGENEENGLGGGGDEAGDVLHTLRGTDGGAAKLHNLHDGLRIKINDRITEGCEGCELKRKGNKNNDGERRVGEKSSKMIIFAAS